MSLPALLGGSPRTLGGRLRHSQLAGSTTARMAVSELEVSRQVYQGSLPKSCRCALPHQSAKEAESAAVQNSAETVLMGSQFWQRCFLDWACDVIPSALKDGFIVSRPAARTQSSSPVSCSPSLRFSPSLGSRYDYYVASVGKPHSSRSARRRRLCISVEVLGQPRPSRVPGLLSRRAGGLLLYLEVDDRFCFFLRWSSGAVCSGCFGACAHEVGARSLSHGVSTFCCSPWLALPACSLGVMILVCFLREVAFSVLVHTLACRTGVQFWLVLVMELHTLRQRGVRVPMV